MRLVSESSAHGHFVQIFSMFVSDITAKKTGSETSCKLQANWVTLSIQWENLKNGGSVLAPGSGLDGFSRYLLL